MPAPDISYPTPQIIVIGDSPTITPTNVGGAADPGGWTVTVGDLSDFGAVIDADTGIITFTTVATNPGNYSVTIQAMNGSGSDTFAITFNIRYPGNALSELGGVIDTDTGIITFPSGVMNPGSYTVWVRGDDGAGGISDFQIDFEVTEPGTGVLLRIILESGA